MGSTQRYAGKVSIVTGGASGIGEAIVRGLVAEGGSVLVADINQARLEALAADLGAACAIRRTDVKSEAEVEALVAASVERFGALDCLFSVAGAARFGGIMDVSEEDWDFTVDLCLKGVLFGMKHAARQMVAAGTRGAIVNVASLNSQVPGWGMSAYCAAKAGVEMLGKSGSIEFGEYGIRVNTVSPGLTRTPANSFLTPEMLDSYYQRIPLGDAASPAQQAEACLFLASDAASYITGVNLMVDGGWANTAYPDMRPFLGGTEFRSAGAA